jgi:hypothetical protein
MRQLTFEDAGRYAWRDVPEPEITSPEQAVVRPLVVACSDLDIAVDQVVPWADAPEVWPTMTGKSVFTLA